MWAHCTAGHRHWGRYGAAGLLLADGGRVLLQLRSRAVQLGGTWSIPGGALEANETPAAAALREAWEECRIPPPEVVPTGSHVTVCGGWPYVTILGRLSAAVDLRGNGEGRAAWVDLADVDGLPLHPAFREAWPVLADML